jgi:hypothetical protein
MTAEMRGGVLPGGIATAAMLLWMLLLTPQHLRRYCRQRLDDYEETERRILIALARILLGDRHPEASSQDGGADRP